MRFNSIFGDFEEAPEVTKPSPFDVLTKLVLPAVSLVAAIIVAQRLQQQRAILWCLLGFAFLSFAVGFYPAVKARTKRWIQIRRCEVEARRRFEEFKTFVRRFGEFVNPGTSDTLHHIVANELCRNNMSDVAKLGMPTIHLFNGFWDWFNRRIDQQKPSLPALRSAIMEFGNMVAAYNSNCVRIIFETTLPADLQTSLTPRVESSLNAFQQRFAAFLREYGQFLKDLRESGVISTEGPIYFSYPKPL